MKYFAKNIHQVAAFALLILSLNVSSASATAGYQPYCLGMPCVTDTRVSPAKGSPRVMHDFNFDWYFTLSDDVSYAKSEKLGEQWKTVRLPHDWSIDFPFDKDLNGATAYLPGGIGWYKKNFATPEASGNKKHFLYFDGIYNHSELWLNGKKIGGERNGYTPFYIDISPFLKRDGSANQLAIRVDRSRYIDSRWYTGSGIYRDVKLLEVADTHIPIWGVFVTTPKISKKSATAVFEIDVEHTQNTKRKLKLETLIYDVDGKLVAKGDKKINLKPGRSKISKKIAIKNPRMWDLDDPHLYNVTLLLKHGNDIVDQYQMNFGVREIRYDAKEGFFLNGVNTPIKGVNVHHDAGLVGAAVPDDVWRRRFMTLKESGVNAIRTAHNPMSMNFMNLCDELGLLVQAEIFDEWDNPKDKRLNQWERHDDYISRGLAEWFQTDAEEDLRLAVLRDRNHPSVVMWSIGNEIEWTYPRYKEATGYFDMNASGNYFYNPPHITPEEIYERFHTSKEGKYVLADTAKKLSAWVKELDTSRPVTANLILPSVSHISGYTDALDIVGYSYRRVIYDYGHRLFPDKMIMGTENVVQWHEWKAIEERDFIPGTFLWTGIDYLGESNGNWPSKAVASGMLDTAGFKKPGFHMMKTLWNDEPHLKLFTQTEEASIFEKSEGFDAVEKEPGSWETRTWYWHDVNSHWNYEEEQSVIVEVLTNCEAVELFVGETSYGEQALGDHPDRIIKWAVPFKAGKLRAEGKGKCRAQDEIVTAAGPYALTLSGEYVELAVDGYSVLHLTAQLRDKAGNPVVHTEREISLKVPAGIEFLGADNGNTRTMNAYKFNNVLTDEGKALFIVRALGGRDLPKRVPLIVEGANLQAGRFEVVLSD